jgi:hypothetical protein
MASTTSMTSMTSMTALESDIIRRAALMARHIDVSEDVVIECSLVFWRGMLDSARRTQMSQCRPLRIVDVATMMPWMHTLFQGGMIAISTHPSDTTDPRFADIEFATSMFLGGVCALCNRDSKRTPPEILIGGCIRMTSLIVASLVRLLSDTGVDVTIDDVLASHVLGNLSGKDRVLDHALDVAAFRKNASWLFVTV